jgi:hypothetical protein
MSRSVFSLPVAVLSLALVGCSGTSAAPVRIGAAARVADNPRSHYSRYVNFRPADGEEVTLNPPRFSWMYDPSWPENPASCTHEFTFQIASDAGFTGRVVDVRTPLNFYNTVPALRPGQRYYWRVGYDVGQPGETWGDTRSFTIAPDATTWDRSALAEPDLAQRGHPRILFSRDSLPAIRALRDSDPGSRAAWAELQRSADQIIQSDWWRSFPPTDRENDPERDFYTIARDLATVAFVWRISGDDRYAGVKERAVTFAGYPQGGRASPEGAGGDSAEDSTQSNEFLALLFDWLYEDLSEQQRQAMIDSLEWRTVYWMNSFAWRSQGRGGPMVRLTYRKGGEHLGDQRLTLPPSEEWRDFEWQVEPPEGADLVYIDLFNYYRRGTVWWDHFELEPGAGAENLVVDPDMAELEGGEPAHWRFSTYNTESKRLVSPDGGRDGEPALGIACASDAERGSWAQQIRIEGAKAFHVAGSYRTENLGSEYLVRPSSLSGCISSHQFEGSMDSAVMGLALYEHSEIGREWFELMLNYLIGVTNGFGFDEAWNEGPGYGNSKMKWLMNATLYFDTALPEAHLGRNPYYRAIGDFFSRVTPVGLPHSPWGNGSGNEGYQRGGRLANFRKLAYLTGEGRFLANWQESGGRDYAGFRPFIEYVLPHYYTQPEPTFEDDPVRLFPIDGWVTVSSRPPSSRQALEEAVGIIFQSRPRGGYSHSFNSDNSFQIHAYGQQINHGGGSTVNQDAYAYHTMSHTTILVDGLGQGQPSAGQRYPWYSRVIAFDRGDDHVYFAGDASNAYPHEPGNYARWGLPLSDVYQQRDCGHLQRFVRHVLFLRNRYFVICDDLRASRPTRFTWLYHVLPEEPFAFDPASFTVRYSVGDVKVVLSHVASRDLLELDDRQGLDGLVNPFTGEDYQDLRKGDLLCGHNLWVTNREPREQFGFLAVICPVVPGQDEPEIEPIDDRTVRVGDDVISFDPATASADEADFVVDTEAVMRQQ